MPHRRVIRPRWLRAALITCFGVLAPAIRPAASQDPVQANGRAVHGIVFDSVGGRPLVGAVVQIVAAGSSAAPRTATTDSAGHYHVDGLPAGQYLVGFYHDALTALGLEAAIRSVEVTAAFEARVDLAIPASDAIRTLRCGESSPFAPGMLVGFVRDAATRGALADARVTVHWRAFALDSANYRVVEERVPATVEPDGTLLACHLPVDAPLDLLVTAPGHHVLSGSVVTVPAMSIGRLELLLVDSALTTGAAVIRGRVMRQSGKEVASGRVVIKALSREAPVQDGEFVAANLPAGTWVAEARVIGVEPQDVLVTATESAVALAEITVSNAPQRLDVVTVVGKPDRNTLLLDDILRRKRIGSSTTFLPGHPALRSATFTSDVMREARGFLYHGPDNIDARGTTGGPCRNVAVYVNDVRQSEGFVGIDNVAPVGEVLAIEAWPDLDFAPVQYRTMRQATYGRASSDSRIQGTALRAVPVPCALVLIWTRRRF